MISFALGALFVILLVAIIMLWSQRTVHKQIITHLQARNEQLAQAIIGYKEGAERIAAREQEFMKKPIVATIRPEEAKVMAQVIVGAMQGKLTQVD